MKKLSERIADIRVHLGAVYALPSDIRAVLDIAHELALRVEALEAERPKWTNTEFGPTNLGRKK